MPLDAPNDYGDTATVRRPGDFKRKGVDGPPYVASLTKTRQPTGKKDELIAQAVAKGIDVPAKVTIPQLKELIGVEPAWELYGRPSGYGDLIDNPFNLIKWKERQLVLGIAINPSLLRELDGCDESNERAALDKIAARAHAAADSDLAAERGTFVHLLTEWAEQNANRSVVGS